MKIKEYDTNELLMIANNVTGEYPEKKVRQAKEELYRRGVEDKVIADIMEEKDEAENYRSGACGGIQGKSVRGTDGRTGGEHTEVGEGTALAAEDENTAGGVRQ